MEVVVHAGMHKTGSTFLQNTLFENPGALARAGVSYLGSNLNHTLDARILAGDARLDMPDDARDAALRRTRAALAEARRRGVRRLLMIGEGIGSRLDAEGAAALRAELGGFADQVRILFYVREPFSFAAASIQEKVKNGMPLGEARRRFGAPRYRHRIEPFIAAFGRSRIDIRVYDKARFVDGDLLADYLDAVGELGLRLALKPTAIRNPTLSLDATLIWERIVALAPEARNWPFRQHVEDAALARGGAPFRLSGPVIDRIAAVAAPDLEWLADTMGERPFKLTPPEPASMEWPHDPALLDQLATDTLNVARAADKRLNG